MPAPWGWRQHWPFTGTLVWRALVLSPPRLSRLAPALLYPCFECQGCNTPDEETGTCYLRECFIGISIVAVVVCLPYHLSVIELCERIQGVPSLVYWGLRRAPRFPGPALLPLTKRPFNGSRCGITLPSVGGLVMVKLVKSDRVG